MIHSSNLCTEITLNTGGDETAVCNLGSIVLDQHLTPDGDLDLDRLRESVRVAVRALDVIDINLYPTEPTRTANSRHRPVGLGVMGSIRALPQGCVRLACSGRVRRSRAEAIAYFAYEVSSDSPPSATGPQLLCRLEVGRGLLPQDTLELLEAERGAPVEVERGGALDWAPLWAKIAAQGMRNSNVLAIAPTATIANIMGTLTVHRADVQEPVRQVQPVGDFTVLNPFLVRDLKAAGIWTAALAEELKARDGDISEIETIPAELRDRYRTAFQIEPEWLIDAAARRQKWIDQSQSLNLFLARPDMKALSHMYRRARHAGLDDVLPAHARGVRGSTRRRLRAAAAATAPEPASAALACSIEAMRTARSARPASDLVAGW